MKYMCNLSQQKFEVNVVDLITILSQGQTEGKNNNGDLMPHITISKATGETLSPNYSYRIAYVETMNLVHGQRKARQKSFILSTLAVTR